jgi:flagellar protein FlaG
MSNEIMGVGSGLAAAMTHANPPPATKPRLEVEDAVRKELIKPTRAPASTPVPDAPTVKVDPQEMLQNLDEAIRLLNEQAAANGRGLNFSVDEKLNRQVIIVKKTETGEVVRQIPTDVAIKVAHNIEDIKGLLLDQRG